MVKDGLAAKVLAAVVSIEVFAALVSISVAAVVDSVVNVLTSVAGRALVLLTTNAASS